MVSCKDKLDNVDAKLANKKTLIDDNRQNTSTLTLVECYNNIHTDTKNKTPSKLKCTIGDIAWGLELK